jgi:hypothetical protein
VRSPGTWHIGSGQADTTVTTDAVALMLHLSGRAGLDLTADHPLSPARVVF